MARLPFFINFEFLASVYSGGLATKSSCRKRILHGDHPARQRKPEPLRPYLNYVGFTSPQVVELVIAERTGLNTERFRQAIARYHYVSIADTIAVGCRDLARD